MNEKNMIIVKKYNSPCGALMLGAFDQKLCLCDWLTEKHRSHIDNKLKRILKAEFKEGSSSIIEKAISQLDEYFAMTRKEFDIPLLFTGTTFQETIWNGLLKIPYGKTTSYGSLAKIIGMPKAVRAVANANAANPISIIVPCHRVIGSDNSLTGYGGGLDRKEYLLKLEKVF